MPKWIHKSVYWTLSVVGEAFAKGIQTLRCFEDLHCEAFIFAQMFQNRNASKKSRLMIRTSIAFCHNPQQRNQSIGLNDVHTTALTVHRSHFQRGQSCERLETLKETKANFKVTCSTLMLSSLFLTV